MDDQAGNPNRSGRTISNHVYLDTTKAYKAGCLIKCPPLVSRSLRSRPSDAADTSRPIAKVVVSLDPLNCNDDSSPQFTMELAGTEAGHIPRCYDMDMSKDFIPMSVFSESSQGKISVEGKILHKFDMKPHDQNLELYGKLCHERTNKYMVKSRQIQGCLQAEFDPTQCPAPSTLWATNHSFWRRPTWDDVMLERVGPKQYQVRAGLMLKKMKNHNGRFHFEAKRNYQWIKGTVLY